METSATGISATGIVIAVNAFVKYEIDIRRSMYLNETTTDVITIRIRIVIEKKLFL